MFFHVFIGFAMLSLIWTCRMICLGFVCLAWKPLFNTFASGSLVVDILSCLLLERLLAEQGKPSIGNGMPFYA